MRGHYLLVAGMLFVAVVFAVGNRIGYERAATEQKQAFEEAKERADEISDEVSDSDVRDLRDDILHEGN